MLNGPEITQVNFISIPCSKCDMTSEHCKSNFIQKITFLYPEVEEYLKTYKDADAISQRAFSEEKVRQVTFF